MIGEANPGVAGGPSGIALDEMLEAEGGFARGPERALMSALLFDGVVAYMNYACFPFARGNSRYKEAFLWVNTRNPEYVFSFDNVCEGLGIHPDALRCGLISASTTHASEWKRARRNF